MNAVGIEAINAFCGTSFIDVKKLAEHRQLDLSRFENLLMKQKTVSLPCEDPISFSVNAAKPIIDALSEEEKDSIELLITCSESGIDFGKSMSTYVHHYLGLKRNCRLLELKSACYSGVAGLQMAVNTILSQTSPGSKALVIATDMTRFILEEDGDSTKQDWSFAEPSGGSGAVAMLVSDTPHVFQMDVGASGYYGYEVMDTCRPVPDSETGDSDLSLLAYLECCEKSYLEYEKRVSGTNYAESFGYLSYHTPFGGMVKGAHRSMMRKLIKASPADIETDFQHRVMPSLLYCQRVGNIMGATLALSLISTLANAEIQTPQRIGCFSYGSGCCSEFFSGVVTPQGSQKVRNMNIGAQLDKRYQLNMKEYDQLLYGNHAVRFGTKNVVLNLDDYPQTQSSYMGSKQLVLSQIKDFHREYVWI